MARIKPADESARSRLRRGSGAADPRAPFRDAIAGLQGEEILEIRPEGAETLRGLKALVTRAGKQAGVDILYGETVDGMLLVWRRSATRGRGRPRRQEPDRSNIIP